MHKIRVTIAIILFTVGCATAPPNLSPFAYQAFYKTQVTKDIDLLRDTAVDANKQVTPLVSTGSMLKIVRWHRSALLIMRAADTGWQDAVSASLDELVKDLPLNDGQMILPYVTLTKTILRESLK